MALYNDIEQWKQILESQDSEKNEFDKACRESAEASAELDKKEFEDLDEDEITLDDFGTTGTEAELENEQDEDFEESIDFSAYGIREEKKEEGEKETLDEADLKEPLTKFAELLGKVVSTANLTGENSARLNEGQDLNKPMTVEEVKEFVKDRIRSVSPEDGLTINVRTKNGRNSLKFKVDASKNDGKVSFSVGGNSDSMPVKDFINAIASKGMKWSDIKGFDLDG